MGLYSFLLPMVNGSHLEVVFAHTKSLFYFPKPSVSSKYLLRGLLFCYVGYYSMQTIPLTIFFYLLFIYCCFCLLNCDIFFCSVIGNKVLEGELAEAQEAENGQGLSWDKINPDNLHKCVSSFGSLHNDIFK